jgi:porin
MIRRALHVLGACACFTPSIAFASGGSNEVRGGEPPQATAHAASPSSVLSAWAASLAARGVHVGGSMTGLWIGDVAGGAQRGGVVNTLGFLGADADLEQLTGGWHGGRAFVNGAWIRGGSVSTAFVGDALVVSNLDGFDSIRLYQAWLEQGIADGRVSLRAGVLSADEEFCGTDGGALFTNSGFGWEAGIGGNVVNGGPIYFAPGVGLRLEARPARGWAVRTGAYDGDSFDSPDGSPDPNRHGVHFQLTRAQGAFLIGELARTWGEGADRRPGALKLGAWRHTADFADKLRDAQGGSFELSGLEPAVHHGNHGGFGVLEQTLWSGPSDATRCVCGWLRLAGAPADRSAFSWVSEGGVHWTGLVPGRKADVLAVGVVTAYVSPDAQQGVRDANLRDGGNRVVPDFERALEAGYQVRVGEHWQVTPGVQWVQHPGTTRETRNAVVAALRVTRD